MIKDLIFDGTALPLLKKGLDAYALRQRAAADNIANAETPGFQRRTVKFEEKLEQAKMSAAASGAGSMRLQDLADRLDSFEPEVELDNSLPLEGEINNIDIDREMAEMSRNSMQFNFTALMARKAFEEINAAIRGAA